MPLLSPWIYDIEKIIEHDKTRIVGVTIGSLLTESLTTRNLSQHPIRLTQVKRNPERIVIQVTQKTKSASNTFSS
jgi:hypothetical protein